MIVTADIYNDGQKVIGGMNFPSIFRASTFFRVVRIKGFIGDDSSLVLTKPDHEKSFMMIYWDIVKPGTLKSWFFAKD